MAPVPDETTLLHLEKRININNTKIVQNKNNSKDKPDNNVIKQDIVWKNVMIMSVIHSVALYGVWLTITLKIKWQTILFNYFYTIITALGVTAGAHRLWAHRCYKSKLPFRIFLMLAQCGCVQDNIYIWVRNHRTHHKFTDTNSDPHNSTRGFFFCHIGWLLMKKHPDVVNKASVIDLSDVRADPVVRFQEKYYIPLVLLTAFAIPIFIPMYFWSDTFWKSFLVSLTRSVLLLNGTWAVNSAAHLWGTRPYDANSNARENPYVSFVTVGEGWHNYHHVFPWDYKAAELGNYRLNLTTALLDFMAYIGQVHELKKVSEDMVERRAMRTGDGSWKSSGNKNINQNDPLVTVDENLLNNSIWGWEDKDLKEEQKKWATITYA